MFWEVNSPILKVFQGQFPNFPTLKLFKLWKFWYRITRKVIVFCFFFFSGQISQISIEPITCNRKIKIGRIEPENPTTPRLRATFFSMGEIQGWPSGKYEGSNKSSRSWPEWAVLESFGYFFQIPHYLVTSIPNFCSIDFSWSWEINTWMNLIGVKSLFEVTTNWRPDFCTTSRVLKMHLHPIKTLKKHFELMFSVLLKFLKYFWSLQFEFFYLGTPFLKDAQKGWPI